MRPFFQDRSVAPAKKPTLEERVLDAAEAALQEQHYVSPIDILTGIRLLERVHVESWRKGRIDYLESMIQGNPEKISKALSIFGKWVREKGLQPSEARYVRTSRTGPVDLRFSATADPQLERFFRTHYVSPDLPERKRKSIEAKQTKAPSPVVFEIVREAECTECGIELPKNSLLFMDANQPLCLACAGMQNLEFLGAGDAALTRRSTKYSGRSAVVVRFSRSRGRYERQGILVEPEAIEKAEQESLGDADQRAKARARDAVRRQEEDRELVVRMTEEIRQLFPRIPPVEARAIAEHTAQRGSGRVGRSAAGQTLTEKALTLAVGAAVRHRHTNYDELLAKHVDREAARERVRDEVQDILADWRGPAGSG